jgi:hypothetical protein
MRRTTAYSNAACAARSNAVACAARVLLCCVAPHHRLRTCALLLHPRSRVTSCTHSSFARRQPSRAHSHAMARTAGPAPAPRLCAPLRATASASPEPSCTRSPPRSAALLALLGLARVCTPGSRSRQHRPLGSCAPPATCAPLPGAVHAPARATPEPPPPAPRAAPARARACAEPRRRPRSARLRRACARAEPLAQRAAARHPARAPAPSRAWSCAATWREREREGGSG